MEVEDMAATVIPLRGPHPAQDAGYEASDRAELHRSQEWRDAVRGIVLILADFFDDFTADDVWKLAPRALEVDEPRALGAVFKRLAHEGKIEATGEYRRSERLACHGRPVAVWRARRTA